MRRPAADRIASRLLVLALLLLALTAAGGSPDQHEVEDIRDQIIDAFGIMPVHVNDSTTVVRVERYWNDQIRVHLASGHTLRVTVELDTY